LIANSRRSSYRYSTKVMKTGAELRK